MKKEKVRLIGRNKFSLSGNCLHLQKLLPHIDIGEIRNSSEVDENCGLVLIDITNPEEDQKLFESLTEWVECGGQVLFIINEGIREKNWMRPSIKAEDFSDPEKKEATKKIIVDELNKANQIAKEMESLQGKFPGLKGESPQIYKIFKHILNYAKTNLEVLIQGETGTGKELIARALHQASPREKRCFVSVNCAAIPPTLFESEFFGHCKGAFTHATECRKGRFLAADKGTIFLDEISETPPRIQVGLLRVLQEGELTPLGKDIPIKVNVRVIVATNKDLLKEVNEGRFREDLYYRLNVLKIYVPPLRERRVDIPILAKEFLKDFKSTNSDFLREMRKSEIEISQKAMEILKNYEWPGNIRELKNVIQRAAMLASINRNFKKDSILIMPEDIKIEDKIRISKHPSLEKVASDLLPLSYERGLKRVIEELKGKIIEMAVQGNRSQKQAAAKLKISEASISQKRNEG